MKALPEKILDIIQQLPEGEVLTPSRFLHHGSRHAVQRGLSRLVEGGKLFRVARGIYVAAVETRFGVRPPAPEKVVHSLANALGEVLVDHGARAANKLGLSTQVPVRYVFLTDGRSRELQVGKTTVSIRCNRLANSPLSTQTSSDKNGWKTKPCPQVYPLNKPVSDVGHAEP
ncbi:DUF6088 family protein, partial [Pseudomonas aeruginosa]|uniref:DUF6088 family protein n=1 Tax=Pseudomonas aeruginosa TaxID=287 RepID=UPI002162951E